MSVELAIQALLKTAKAEVGYLEKKTPSQLDDKTANAGSANYTKYSRDLVTWVGSPYSNAVAWCDNFVDWCFIVTFGKDKAKELLGGWSAYTPTSANYFRFENRLFTSNPKAGDQIFLGYNGSIGHTGIVTANDGKIVYTVEGNTSGRSTVIPNGGAVCAKSYPLTYTGIIAYGRPDFTIVGDDFMTDDEIYEAFMRATAKKTVSPYAVEACKKGVAAGAFADGNGDGMMDKPQSPLLRQDFAVVANALGLFDK